LRRSLRAPSLAVVSSYEAAEQALDAGYDDVIVASYDPRELRLRVRKLLRAGDPNTMRAGTLVISPVARQVRRWREEIELTHREFDLLLYLVENAGRAVGHDELLTTCGAMTMLKEAVKPSNRASGGCGGRLSPTPRSRATW